MPGHVNLSICNFPIKSPQRISCTGAPFNSSFEGNSSPESKIFVVEHSSFGQQKEEEGLVGVANCFLFSNSLKF